jgi:sugar O-acyltransferase (sialic acid O-acetyltransferase NeuD family)
MNSWELKGDNQSMITKKIALYGGGGFGREVAWLIQSCSSCDTSYEIACFIDDDSSKRGTEINEIQVMDLEKARRVFPEAHIVCVVGNPQKRQKLIERVAKNGFGFETIIHPGTEKSKWIDIGIGTIICAGNILTTNIVIGRHVHINLDCTIGHDVVLGDFTTIAPGVHISGWVHCGKRVYIGTGAVIVNGTEDHPITIGNDVTIGAGACVTRSVKPGTTVVGIPAKPLVRK